MTKYIFLLIFLCTSVYLQAQKCVISGFMSDSLNGESLINASVWIKGTNKGCVSNAYGFYSLQLPAGDYTLYYSYVGYKTDSIHINLSKDISINKALKIKDYLHDINVKANRNNTLVKRMSTISVDIAQTHKTPTIMGEPDIFKIMQLSPGVEGGLEGSSGLHVRGGGNGQNLILIDGIPVYNVSHLMGYISVFNPEAIRKTELIKGGIPARYGGRASSVVDVRMKEGTNKKLKGVINISTIMAGGMIEGPIGEKTSFMLAGRRTILDPLYNNFNNAQSDYDMLYSCWDLNAKLNHKINSRNRVYASFFTGFDHARTNNVELTNTIVDKTTLPNGVEWTDSLQVSSLKQKKYKWGNLLGAVRWNHVYNSRLFSNLSVYYTNFYNKSEDISLREEVNLANGKVKNDNTVFQSISDIEDFSLKMDYDWFINNSHTIRYGAQGIYHRFRPSVQFDSVYNANLYGQHIKPALEASAFVEDELELGIVDINIGLRYSTFAIEKQQYWELEPRLSVAVNISDRLCFKSSYQKSAQYVHLVAPSSIGYATDYWVPASNNLPPENVQQIATGAYYRFFNGLKLEVEGYYKRMDNVIEFRDDKAFTMHDQNWENFMTVGKGWSYGVETCIKKEEGVFTGWISYTWSRSWRQFDDLNMGTKFPYKYDRPHNLTFVGMYRPNKKFDVGLNWILASGYNYTFGKELISRLETYYYERNNMRYPTYHRMDVGVNLHKQKKHGKRTWRFGAYNTYNQMNTSYYRVETYNGEYTFDDQGNITGTYVPAPKITNVTLFPIIPYVSYRFEFGASK